MTDIRHLSGQDIVTDMLFRVEVITAPVKYDVLATAQDNHDDLQTLLMSNTAVQLKKLLIPGTSVKLYHDAFAGNIQPFPAACHSFLATFIHRGLRDSTHVFLWQDAIHRPLDPPYNGPHKIIACTDKTFKIVVRGQQVTASADEVKPTYILEGTQYDISTITDSPPAQPHSASAVTPPTQAVQTTRSGVMWEHPTCPTTALSPQQLCILSAEHSTPCTEPNSNLLQSRTKRDCNLQRHQPTNRYLLA
jgi:hypothetical protein